MIPIDDSIPEEHKQSYHKLITYLRQAIPVATSVTVEEQSHILTKVKAQLQKAGAGVKPIDLLSVRLENPAIVPPSSSSVGKASYQPRRMRRGLNMLAAVLMVGVIVGASLLLFTIRSQSISDLGSGILISEPAGPVSTPVSARVQAGGLEASVRITSGPYFLSELLGVDIILTNHSNKSVFLAGLANANFCDPVFSIITQGGGEPQYSMPIDPVTVSCLGGQTTLDAGKTLTVQDYVPLLKSGQLTLTVGARFLTVKKDNAGGEVTMTGSSPLDGHWPVTHINVATKIPSDRILSLQQQGSHIIVHAPPSVQSHLVYLYSVRCTGGSGTNGQWTPLTTPAFQEPECSGLNKHWSFAVSAPGYAIASGAISALLST